MGKHDFVGVGLAPTRFADVQGNRKGCPNTINAQFRSYLTQTRIMCSFKKSFYRKIATVKFHHGSFSEIIEKLVHSP